MRTLPALLLALASFLQGCESEQDRLAAVASLAAAPAGGRAQAAAQLATLARAGSISFDAALTDAFDRCEASLANPAAAPGATAYAGAVLDAIAQAPLSLDPHFELFWMRVGGLAFKSAEAAVAAGLLPQARALVLAGGPRWQNDSYWSRRPDHDALAALILANTGSRTEAIQRLRSRPDLQLPATQVLAELESSR